ncbi:MAG: SDR family oxidoreductase [Verrucomicrobiales bacterium]|nr:SDR family oxidoreductase [Verrucomicrobiales bacterium]
MADPSFSGKTVLVVGGSRGMGLSAVRRLLAADAQVMLTAPDAAGLQAALEECKSTDPRVAGVVANVLDAGAGDQAVAAAVARFGQLDALYHVAGGSGRSRGDGPLHQLSDEGWEYTLELNLRSVMQSNRAALRQFLAQGRGGVILNLASVLAWSPSPRHFASHAYAAAKAGIIGLSRAAAASYAAEDIRINVLAPGLIETPMSQRACEEAEIRQFVTRKQPLGGGRTGQVEDVDGAALFLLSSEARFITGQVLAVDGGWTVSEGLPSA